jgi:hypothetical protein
MAVGTNGPKICLRVQKVLGANLTEWPKVVDMYVAQANFTVLCGEVKGADDTLDAPPTDAANASAWVAFIDVHRDCSLRSLNDSDARLHLLWEELGMWSFVFPKGPANLYRDCVLY